MQQKNEDTYKKIIKATSLFGSVQLMGLLVSIVRSKVLAQLIGPAGYGLFSLLNSTVEMVRQLCGFSIETSGVKAVAEANTNAPDEIPETTSVVRKIAVLTGLLGVAVAIVFSGLLSRFAYGDYTGVWAIILVSVSILFKQLTSSQSAIIQGLSKLKVLAKINLFSNLLSLFFTLPLYFIWGVDAIVPAILFTSLITFFTSFFFYRKLSIPTVKLKPTDATKKGKSILYFGGLLSLTAFLPTVVNYCLQVLINKIGGLNEVGIFNVTIMVVNTYVGVVFTAMSTEYYPRLASINKNREEEANAINAQAILSMLIMVPIVVFFLGFSTLIIRVFFSREFLAAVPVLSWAMVGMFFKAVSFSMGYVIIARADSKVFTKTAVIFNILYFLACFLGYYYFGLEGLGLGMAGYFLLHLVAIYFLIRIRYGIKPMPEFYYVFLAGLSFCCIALVIYNLVSGSLNIILFTVLFILSVLYSLYEINKRIGLKNVLVKFFKRKRGD
ncbi:oligosaccharide flippase family protein [Flavobacterium sp. ST-75]|uniref:Oligosaccharide flippase family protein n=1 Tax=Flavobacterium rhizophilum TaxID=3163296 RepID=A0ABW8YDA6_9FLAO